MDITGDEATIVRGASGGVGLALAHLARARGARVIAATSSVKASDLLDVGAAHTIDRTAEDLRSLAHHLGINCVDTVADTAGGPFIAELLPLVGDDGRWVIASAVAGPLIDVALRRPYLHTIRLVGSSIHAWALRHAATGRRSILRSVFIASFRLTEIATTQAHFGKSAIPRR